MKKFLCNDCRVDVLVSGDWYMAAPQLWKKQLGLGWEDNLCLPCLEKRLGRKVKPFTDIWPIPISQGRTRTLNSVEPKTCSARVMVIFAPQSKRRQRSKSAP